MVKHYLTHLNIRKMLVKPRRCFTFLNNSVLWSVGVRESFEDTIKSYPNLYISSNKRTMKSFPSVAFFLPPRARKGCPGSRNVIAP